MHIIEYKVPGKEKRHKIEVTTTKHGSWSININGGYILWSKTDKLNNEDAVESRINEMIVWAIYLLKSDIPLNYNYLSGDMATLMISLNMSREDYQ